MQTLKKIAGINLLILLVYTAIVFFSNLDTGGSLTILVVLMVIIGIHVFINLVLGIIFFTQKDNERGRAFLLSALIVLVVGFSSCFGSGLLADEVSNRGATYM